MLYTFKLKDHSYQLDQFISELVYGIFIFIQILIEHSVTVGKWLIPYSDFLQRLMQRLNRFLTFFQSPTKGC